jgi:hypothetical protein
LTDVAAKMTEDMVLFYVNKISARSGQLRSVEINLLEEMAAKSF